MSALVFRHQVHDRDRHGLSIRCAVIDARGAPADHAHEILIERHVRVRAGPSFAQRGIGRFLFFQDVPHDVRSGGDFRKRFDDMGQELKRIRFVIVWQLEKPPFLECVQNRIHDQSPP